LFEDFPEDPDVDRPLRFDDIGNRHNDKMIYFLVDNIVKSFNDGKKVPLDGVDLESIESEDLYNQGLVGQFPQQENLDVYKVYEYILENNEMLSYEKIFIMLCCVHIYHGDRLFGTSLINSFVDTYSGKEIFLSNPLFFNATIEQLETFFNRSGSILRINFDFDMYRNDLNLVSPPLQIFQILLRKQSEHRYLFLLVLFEIINHILQGREKMYSGVGNESVKFDLLETYSILEQEPRVIEDFKELRQNLSVPIFEMEKAIENYIQYQVFDKRVTYYERTTVLVGFLCIKVLSVLLWYKNEWSYDHFSKIVKTQSFKSIGKIKFWHLVLLFDGHETNNTVSDMVELKYQAFLAFLSPFLSDEVKTNPIPWSKINNWELLIKQKSGYNISLRGNIMKKVIGNYLSIKDAIIRTREETRKMIRGSVQAMKNHFPDPIIAEVIFGAQPWERITIGVDNFVGDYNARKDRIIKYIEYELYIASQLKFKSTSSKRRKNNESLISWAEYIASFVFKKKKRIVQSSTNFSSDDLKELIEKIKPVFSPQRKI